jgi:hypothetical protein
MADAKIVQQIRMIVLAAVAGMDDTFVVDQTVWMDTALLTALKIFEGRDGSPAQHGECRPVGGDLSSAATCYFPSWSIRTQQFRELKLIVLYSKLDRMVFFRRSRASMLAT